MRAFKNSQAVSRRFGPRTYVKLLLPLLPRPRRSGYRCGGGTQTLTRPTVIVARLPRLPVARTANAAPQPWAGVLNATRKRPSVATTRVVRGPRPVIAVTLIDSAGR